MSGWKPIDQGALLRRKGVTMRVILGGFLFKDPVGIIVGYMQISVGEVRFVHDCNMGVLLNRTIRLRLWADEHVDDDKRLRICRDNWRAWDAGRTFESIDDALARHRDLPVDTDVDMC